MAKKNKKTKILQIRLTEHEFYLINEQFKILDEETGVKISKSDFIRFSLSRAGNLDFLYQIGYLDIRDVMDAQLFNRTKYQKLYKNKKCKR